MNSAKRRGLMFFFLGVVYVLYVLLFKTGPESEIRIGYIVGGGIVVAGIVMYLRAPKED